MRSVDLTMMRVLVLLAMSVLLGACAPEFTPAPGYQGGFLWESDKSRTITVQPGDTIYTISRRYDVPSKMIIARNGLTPPYALTVGQSLILDPTRTHLVVRGDTLSQLAVTYNVEMRLLASANDLRPPYVIHVGQELWIPDPFTIAAAPSAQVATAQPLSPVGEATSGTASRAPRSAISTETLTPPPGASAFPPPAQQAVATPPLESAPSQPVQSQTVPSQPVAEAPVSPSAPVPEAVPAAAPEPEVALAIPRPLAEPAPRAAARFSWPLRGKVVAGFGSAGKGLHNDGINIAAPAGTEVRAADNGVVAYAGNELKGFGNLLLIKHADGWTTAYAHNDKLLVSRGDQVAQGQVIAVVGRTGNVDSPQLHFEIRRGTQAIDPLLHLAK
jgi:murein DD-endopeptidase MepM/ murein hydrolase activator NlpD